MANDPFIRSKRADVARQTREHEKLLNALENEAPTITENRLTSVYLPHMANTAIPFPWAAWVNEVSWMSTNAVNIIGSRGEVVGQVPPLCDTDGLQSKKFSTQKALPNIIADSSDLANRTPHIAQQVLYGLVSKHIPVQTNNPKLMQRWDEFFAKYGYANPFRAGESKSTTSANGVDKTAEEFYTDGELL